jgi:hypothetical protein
MSFRLFVYYCALGGAWSGFIGWLLARLLAPQSGQGYFHYVLRTSMFGMFLGLAVAFALSLLDATFSVSLRQLGKVSSRVFVAVVVGIMGGLFGSFIGGSLFYLTQWSFFLRSLSFVASWTMVGFLIGMSISFFEIFASLVSQRDFAGAVKKFGKCLVGGTIGGVLGGVIALGLRIIAEAITERDIDELRTPTALGFIAIGACIGLLVGLAQVMLKEAWIKVEAGFRPGREMLLHKETTSIGRAEGSDIALFGDSGVEKVHANIVLDGGRYFLEDLQSPGGSYVNDRRVVGRTPLKAGDLIRVGRSVLVFHERARRNDQKSGGRLGG